jgi:hypothetical protein
MESSDHNSSQYEGEATNVQISESKINQKYEKSIVWVWGECSSVIKLGNTLWQECYEVEDELTEQDQPKKIKNKFMLFDTQNEEINKLLSNEAREVREKLGPFKFRDKSVSNLKQIYWFTDMYGFRYLGEGNPKIKTKEGRGMRIGRRGCILEGNFENNKWNGIARYISNNGTYYIGEQLHHQYHGQVKYEFIDGSVC